MSRYAAAGIAYMGGLIVFAYFASVIDMFPGELAVSVWVQSLRTDWLDAAILALARLGSFELAIPIVLAASVVIYLRGWRTEAGVLLATSVVGQVLSIVIKETVARPRPTADVVDVLSEERGYSFPSNHAMLSTVFLGMLMVILVGRMSPGWPRSLAYVAALALVLASGFSRLYLGVHWMMDVLAGYAFGVAVVAGAMWVWARIRKRAVRRTLTKERI